MKIITGHLVELKNVSSQRNTGLICSIGNKAIQVLRVTFLANFRSPSALPHVTLGDAGEDTLSRVTWNCHFTKIGDNW